METDRNLNDDFEIDDECWQSAIDELIEWEKMNESLYDEKLQYYLGHSVSVIPEDDKDYIIEEHLSRDDHFTNVRHVGYATVKKKESRNKLVFKIDEIEFCSDNKIDSSIVLYNFVETSFVENHPALVCQWTVCAEDDFQGYLLFPMDDKRYWVIWYES